MIACNVTRRNMSTGARAMSTALVLDAAGKRSNGRVDYGELKQQLSESGQSRQRMAEAFVVLDFKPDQRHISTGSGLRAAADVYAETYT